MTRVKIESRTNVYSWTAKQDNEQMVQLQVALEKSKFEMGTFGEKIS